MLRSLTLAGLNQLEVLCQEAVVRYGDIAATSKEAAFRAFVDALATARREQASELAECIRSLGELPDAADADRETIRHWFVATKAVLAEAGHGATRVYAAEVEHVEAALLRQAGDILRHQPNGELRSVVEGIRNAAESALQELRRWQN